MNGISMLFHVVRADVLERTRRYGFFVTGLVAVYAGYLFIPPNHASYATLQIAGYRGIYNSAWIGALTSMLTSVFLALAGFYLVKNTIDHDRRTHVGDLLASTQLSPTAYIFGKITANFVILFLIMVVVIVAAATMQVIRGEESHIAPGDLLLPFLLTTIPVIVAVSAGAVLFESISFLRGGIGNVIYFFLWAFALSGEETSGFGLLGTQSMLSGMRQSLLEVYPHLAGKESEMSLGFSIKAGSELWHLRTFVWSGLSVDGLMLLQRVPVLVIGIALSLGASIFFPGFGDSPAAEQLKKSSRKKRRSSQPRDIDVAMEQEATREHKGSDGPRMSERIPLPRFLRFAILEFLIVTKGLSGWWYAVALLIAALGLTLPYDVASLIIGPAIFIWPLFLWSGAGTRDAIFGTRQILGSSPHPVRRHIAAQLLAGTAIGIICASGLIARLIWAGAGMDILFLSIGLVFPPSMALALGIWSGSSRMFEILYVLLWYMGPLNKVPALDYTGISAGNGNLSVAITVFLATIFLTILAAIGKSLKSAQV